jgi:SNF2 family DNA or RNA helicase
MLTATPCKNDVSEVYNLLRFCAIHHNDKTIKRFKGNHFAFKRKFMESYSVNFGKRNTLQFKGFRNKEEYKALYTKYVYRKKLKQVYLPPEVNTMLKAGDFSMDKDIAGLIDSFDKEHFMTMKALAAELLTKFTIDFVKDMDHQAVIFTDHVKSAESLSRGLKLPCITGKLGVSERVKIIEGFKSKKIKHLIATYKCAGVGLSLVNCNYMIFNDLPFVPADLRQAKGRIARVTQSRTCFYYYIGLSSMYFKLFSLLKKKTIVLDEIQ